MVDEASDTTAGETEVERLRRDCGEAYQAVGVILNRLGWLSMREDHPWYLPLEKLMDNLAAARDGEPRPHDDLLPFILSDVACRVMESRDV